MHMLKTDVKTITFILSVVVASAGILKSFFFFITKFEFERHLIRFKKPD